MTTSKGSASTNAHASRETASRPPAVRWRSSRPQRNVPSAPAKWRSGLQGLAKRGELSLNISAGRGRKEMSAKQAALIVRRVEWPARWASLALDTTVTFTRDAIRRAVRHGWNNG